MLYFYNMSRAKQENLVFKALADPRRRQLLDLLKHSPRITGDLCSHFKDIDRCTVMQHLGVLEKAELIIVRRKGRERWNYLNPVPIQRISDRWISRYATNAVSLLARLKQDLEADS
jgi:DNA-binding transcriptional ArsR family regulator